MTLNLTNSIMKWKIILFFLFIGTIGTNAQYRYKNIEVTATSKDGKVRSSGRCFILTCDSVEYCVSMLNYDVEDIWITNHSSEPIIIKWKNISASNDKYSSRHIDPVSSDIDDIRTGEQKIYPKGDNLFDFYYGRLLSKKKKSTVNVYVSLIQNGEAKTVSIKLDGNPIK